MPFETTASRLWKHLSGEERLGAAQAFFQDPAPEALGSALAAIARARRLRPQVARALPDEQRAAMLGSILDPGEAVASALLVALHLSQRRPMLAAFLDALGLAHEDGVLKEEAEGPPPVDAAAARAAVLALLAAFPKSQVRVYLNTLWLQDAGRWAALPEAAASAG